MIDFDGYRPNVGIVICNRKGQVLWAKRYGQNSWQFPQGGINDNETPEQAMYRELFEEVGLTRKDVKLLYVSKQWLRYKLPKRLLRYDSKPMCIGQKQRWFLLQLVSDEKDINMQTTKSPEFDGWRWVNFWYPVRQVVPFKKEVYRKAMKEFAGVLFNPKNQPNAAPQEQKTSLTHSATNTPNKHSGKKYSSGKYYKRSFHRTRGA
ncbi:RNA pyrophosphohydrolase [Avibacterium sp. 20-15]|nr:MULTISPECIES: RNA pyrophosphohydrolase [unclassified Avibacterium]MCW9699394.1 RNA pyrophosphohydrolase [Avibacterium sp. 20-129]MCW9717848.1 RNA pyrophosphohydrolase [Avibacterium sp. 21-599]MCW9733460.1 RNA pyrophosphohydrolase [Avibacterium sp. 20-15]URL03326.1 RNA pyrophosphohydrolase [Avibacterium sp. 20-132]URL06201.1 RNA pyrophosphohydrolase [Avibacterium sp. 21-595]